MRVSAKVQVETRERILRAAVDLFQEHGFRNTTTRDIARTAGIAAGTIFNYFPTKKALAAAVVGEGLNRAEDELRQRLRGDEPLTEALVLHVVYGLRELRPHRMFLGEALDELFTPFTVYESGEAGEVRRRHLENVRSLIVAHGDGAAKRLSPATLHLYWSLYLGALSFWTSDGSHNQEETFSLVKRSIGLFASSLTSGRQAGAKR